MRQVREEEAFHAETGFLNYSAKPVGHPRGQGPIRRRRALSAIRAHDFGFAERQEESRHGRTTPARVSGLTACRLFKIFGLSEIYGAGPARRVWFRARVKHAHLVGPAADPLR